MNEPSSEMVKMIEWLGTLLNNTIAERHEMVGEKLKQFNSIAEIDGTQNFYTNWLNDVVVSFAILKSACF